jgi:hypothetical protein
MKVDDRAIVYHPHPNGRTIPIEPAYRPETERERELRLRWPNWAVFVFIAVAGFTGWQFGFHAATDDPTEQLTDQQVTYLSTAPNVPPAVRERLMNERLKRLAAKNTEEKPKDTTVGGY